MAMAGWKASDMMSGIEGIMNLAAASGEDLGTTSDIVTDALTAFNLKASDSTHFADVLARASANANTNVSKMGQTFQYVAPVAGAMGYSIEDTALAIGLMANAGIKGEKAVLHSVLSLRDCRILLQMQQKLLKSSRIEHYEYRRKYETSERCYERSQKEFWRGSLRNRRFRWHLSCTGQEDHVRSSCSGKCF